MNEEPRIRKSFASMRCECALATTTPLGLGWPCPTQRRWWLKCARPPSITTCNGRRSRMPRSAQSVCQVGEPRLTHRTPPIADLVRKFTSASWRLRLQAPPLPAVDLAPLAPPAPPAPPLGAPAVAGPPALEPPALEPPAPALGAPPTPGPPAFEPPALSPPPLASAPPAATE